MNSPARISSALSRGQVAALPSRAVLPRTPTPTSSTSSSPSPRPQSLPAKKLLLTTIAMAGIQICYSAQFNLVTSHFLHLHLPVHLVSLAWLAGPLSGLLVQPIIGFASDTCTHPLGRRRPFLIIGSLLTASSMLLFANAEPIADILTTLPGAPSSERLALLFAIASFFSLDFAVQAVQAPLRALLTDILPPSQLASGNSCIALFVGMGNLCGSLLAGSHMTPWFESRGIQISHIQLVFLIAAILLLITVAITVITTKEKPQRRRRSGTVIAELLGDDRGKSVRARMLRVLRRIPRPFWGVFTVQLCTWCGFFTLFVFLNAWVGTNVYAGDASGRPGAPERAVYEKGVRLGGMGNALTAVVTMLYSAVLPRLLKCGVMPVYVFSQVVEAACLMAAYFIRGTPGKLPSRWLQFATVVDIGVFGITWATTMTLPWTLIGRALESDPFYAKHFGLFTTLFNASQSFPQLVVAFVAPLILGVWNDSAVVMFVGGICALVGAALVVLLKVDREIRKKGEGDLEEERGRLLDEAAT